MVLKTNYLNRKETVRRRTLNAHLNSFVLDKLFKQILIFKAWALSAPTPNGGDQMARKNQEPSLEAPQEKLLEN